jgi:hypothetical protein
MSVDLKTYQHPPFSIHLKDDNLLEEKHTDSEGKRQYKRFAIARLIYSLF